MLYLVTVAWPNATKRAPLVYFRGIRTSRIALGRPAPIRRALRRFGALPPTGTSPRHRLPQRAPRQAAETVLQHPPYFGAGAPSREFDASDSRRVSRRIRSRRDSERLGEREATAEIAGNCPRFGAGYPNCRDIHGEAGGGPIFSNSLSQLAGSVGFAGAETASLAIAGAAALFSHGLLQRAHALSPFRSRLGHRQLGSPGRRGLICPHSV